MNPGNSEANSLPDRCYKNDESEKQHEHCPFGSLDSGAVEYKLKAGEQQHGKTEPCQCVSIGPALVKLQDSYLLLSHLPLLSYRRFRPLCLGEVTISGFAERAPRHAERKRLARERGRERPRSASQECFMLPLFRVAQVAKPVAYGAGVQTCSYRRKAPGRSHQPRGGCRGTPSPSDERLVKAAQRRNTFSADI